jgi:hypothetical protein
MAFKVETGDIVDGANSYGSVAGANTYFTDRGGMGWTGTDDQKQSYLIQATDYIESRYGHRFIGEKIDADEQSLSWPRDAEGYEEDEIPEALKKATYEYANRARVAPLAPDPVTDTSGLPLFVNRRKVGPIETEVRYQLGSTVQTIKPYPAADMLLRPLLMPSGGVHR